MFFHNNVCRRRKSHRRLMSPVLLMLLLLSQLKRLPFPISLDSALIIPALLFKLLLPHFECQLRFSADTCFKHLLPRLPQTSLWVDNHILNDSPDSGREPQF